MNNSRILGAVCACVLTLMFSSSHAALVSVLNGQAVYDSGFDITWVSDANLAQTNQFGLTLGGPSPDIFSSGSMTRANADAWIAGMNAANYLGFNDWRMPATLIPDPTCTVDTAGTTPSGDSTSYNCTGSEMGHLYYTELGNPAGGPMGNTGSFTNIQAGAYRSDTLFASDPNLEWLFDVSGAFNGQGGTGFQVAGSKFAGAFVWAVRDGGSGLVSSVPIPAALWLFGSGLLGLIGIARRKKVA